MTFALIVNLIVSCALYLFAVAIVGSLVVAIFGLVPPFKSFTAPGPDGNWIRSHGWIGALFYILSLLVVLGYILTAFGAASMPVLKVL